MNCDRLVRGVGDKITILIIVGDKITILIIVGDKITKLIIVGDKITILDNSSSTARTVVY